MGCLLLKTCEMSGFEWIHAMRCLIRLKEGDKTCPFGARACWLVSAGAVYEVNRFRRITVGQDFYNLVEQFVNFGFT